MGSPYAQNRGAGGGSAYAKQRPVSAALSGSKPHGHGILGFFTSAGHAIGSKAELAARDVKGIPGGLIDTVNKGVIQPYKDVLTTGHVSAKTNRRIDKAINQQSDQVEQTLKHPLQDPFATALTVLPALHGAGRVGSGAVEAARAARAGEGLRAVAKAATRKPEDIPRLLRSGDKQVALIPSKNAAVRAAQGAYDRLLQRGLDRNPQGMVARHAQKRLGGALDEEARIQQKMRAVPANRLDAAAQKLNRFKGPGVRRENQAALELASVNTPPDLAAAYHLKQAADGVNPELNLQVGRLYQRVHARRLLTTDENGDVHANTAEHPQLAKTDRLLARVQGEGDKILVEKGVRTEDALKARRDAPGRIRAGATYEQPTPGKQGVESPTLARERARLVSLRSRHEDALTKDAAWLAQTQGRDLRGPMGREEATARLAELDTQHEALLRKLAPEVNPYTAEQSAAETRSRNTLRGRMAQGKKASTGRAQEGRAFAPSKTIKTVTQEVRDLAETKLLDTIAKHKGNPVADRAGALVEERDRLRSLLNRGAEAAFSGEKAPALPRSGARPDVPLPSNPLRNRIVTLGHAIEEQQGRVTRLERQAAARVKPTGIVGGETARPGRGFVSERVTEKRLSRAEASSSRGQVVGAAKAPIDNKTYTGRALEHGYRPKDVTGSASRHYRQVVKFLNTDARRRVALETGSETRRSVRDVLVREPDQTPEQLHAAIQKALGRETSAVDSPDELAAHDAAVREGLAAAHRAFHEHLVPHLKQGEPTEAVGMKATAGFRWVDRHALGELAKAAPAPRTPIGHYADNVNSAVTAATVYFKVGHVGTRVLTNAATNIIQGSANPLQMRRSWKLWHDLSSEDQDRALAASGQHGFASLPHEGTGVVSRVAGKGAQWWAKHADAIFRFNSLAHEMRKAGYGSAQRFREGLDALQTGGQGLPAHEWAKVSAAARRADREAISYDRLSDFERRYIARAVWFYPWVKGSTLFTVRSAIEHPFKTAALVQAGQRGREQQLQMLGPTPSYEAGLIPLGGGAKPLTTDFSTFSPFATSADLLDAVSNRQTLAGQLNPAAGALDQLVNGLNQYGSSSTSPLKDALLSLGSPTPEQQLAEAYAARGQDQSQRMFHKTFLGALARFAGGPAVPRHASKSALAKAAARQRSGQR